MYLNTWLHIREIALKVIIIYMMIDLMIFYMGLVTF